MLMKLTPSQMQLNECTFPPRHKTLIQKLLPLIEKAIIMCKRLFGFLFAKLEQGNHFLK